VKKTLIITGASAGVGAAGYLWYSFQSMSNEERAKANFNSILSSNIPVTIAGLEGIALVLLSIFFIYT
jgi:hypothetical protein